MEVYHDASIWLQPESRASELESPIREAGRPMMWAGGPACIHRDDVGGRARIHRDDAPLPRCRDEEPPCGQHDDHAPRANVDVRSAPGVRLSGALHENPGQRLPIGRCRRAPP